MKAIVIYNSQTGFTKRYAEWIAEKSGADCYELSEAKKKNSALSSSYIFSLWGIYVLVIAYISKITLLSSVTVMTSVSYSFK